MYRVVAIFADLQDREHVYYPGDAFPRDGAEVSEERLRELSTANNRLGKPLIEKVEKKVEAPIKDAKDEEKPSKKKIKKVK